MSANKSSLIEELEKLRAKPLDYICEFMDTNLLHVGKKIFRLLALQPCSVILPDISFNSTNIRSSFNVLFLAPPSSGKSTACKKYASLMSFRPYEIRKVTSSKLSADLSRMKLFTLILEDFSQIGNDYDVIKVIEGAIGDEKRISKKTMREDTESRTQGCGVMAGTWSDLSRYLEYFKGGLLFRFVFLFVDLNKKQHEEIGNYINNSIGNSEKSLGLDIKEQAIRVYFDELYKIMAGEHENINQIKGYHFDENIKKEIFSIWKKKTLHLTEELDFNFSRQLHEAYRFLISSALLNVHNRKVKDGILYPNEQDSELAVELMKDNLDNVIALLKSKAFLSAYGYSNIGVALASKIPETTKKILINLTSGKLNFRE